MKEAKNCSWELELVAQLETVLEEITQKRDVLINTVRDAEYINALVQARKTLIDNL